VKNLLGFSWAVIEPLAMMLILWIVFSFIYHRHDRDGYPFIAFLLCGMVAYDFFNKTINQATRSIQTFSFLIKQVNFRIAILPIIIILSELFLHFIILVIVAVILFFNHIYPSVYWLQVFYYLFASSVLLLGLSWLTSSIHLFFPDIYVIISIVMRLLFFMSPIFWNPSMLDPSIIKIFRLSPLYYLVEGYRNCFLYKIPFWQDVRGTVSFWCFTLFFLLAGVFVFKKLRPQFADVI